MISYFIWFDLDAPGNRDDMVYYKFETWSPYYLSFNNQYMLSNSGYCGALFLGVL